MQSCRISQELFDYLREDTTNRSIDLILSIRKCDDIDLWGVSLDYSKSIRSYEEVQGLAVIDTGVNNFNKCS